MISAVLFWAVLAFLAQDAFAVVVPWPGSKTVVPGNMLENACKDGEIVNLTWNSCRRVLLNLQPCDA